ncbi:MAG TPA: AMIN domain-containing protein [bacterium]|nr:AMIN domain-containing protein [bacterium]
MSQARGAFGSRLLPRAVVGGVVLALMCAALPAGAFAQAAAPVTVQRVNVVEEAGAVEIGIEATGPVGYRTMVLDDPVRYVIDLPAAKNGSGRPTQRVGVGALQTVRVGQVTDTPPVTRVVLDLSQAVQWSVRHPSAEVVVVRLAVPEAHGPAVSPWSGGAAASTGTRSGATTDAGSAAPAPERPWGARVDAGVSPAPGAQASGGGGPSADSVRAGPPAGVPGIVVAQQSSGTGRLLTLDLRDAQLGDVLDALARLCGLNVVTDASVSGARVTVHLVGVTCEEALRFVLDANGLGYRRVGETLIVQPIARLTPPPPGPVMRVYRLQYLQPPIDAQEALVGGNGGGGTLTGGAGPVKKDVVSLIALFAGTGAQIVYDDRTNSLVATGTPPQQEAVVALLRQLDVPIPQVVVQALVVDVTATMIKNLGITWSIFNGFNLTEAVPGAGQFGIGPITRDALTAKLQAAITNGNAKVLSDPRLSTYDGQEALIFAGDQIPIVNTTTSGNPPVTSQTVTFQPIGVTLKIVPKINSDRTINVLVHPLVTTATSFTSATTTNPNGLPIIAAREAVTSLRVGDGDSVVLGGLMRYSDVRNLQKIPFLGDLPFLGSLFQFATVNHSESEVVIVLTPRIVATGQPVPVQQP